MSEIKKIEHIGTTGGIDGDYSYSFSDNQIVEFMEIHFMSLIIMMNCGINL